MGEFSGVSTTEVHHFGRDFNIREEQSNGNNEKDKFLLQKQQIFPFNVMLILIKLFTFGIYNHASQ